MLKNKNKTYIFYSQLETATHISYMYSYFCTTMYFKGRVTLFFANNYLNEYRITMEF